MDFFLYQNSGHISVPSTCCCMQQHPLHTILWNTRCSAVSTVPRSVHKLSSALSLQWRYNQKQPSPVSTCVSSKLSSPCFLSAHVWTFHIRWWDHLLIGVASHLSYHFLYSPSSQVSLSLPLCMAVIFFFTSRSMVGSPAITSAVSADIVLYLFMTLRCNLHFWFKTLFNVLTMSYRICLI